MPHAISRERANIRASSLLYNGFWHTCENVICEKKPFFDQTGKSLETELSRENRDGRIFRVRAESVKVLFRPRVTLKNSILSDTWNFE